MMSRGSEWRRWDLHVHTPETILNDGFGNWEEYLATIESHPDMKVLGVTDYMTISNYLKLKEYKKQGRIKNIDLLIPNIEFRIAPQSDKATAVNIHFLISPDEEDHEHEILNALARLPLEYKGHTYSCVPEQLMSLGKAIEVDKHIDDRVALEKGVMRFKVDFTTLKRWFESERWIYRNSLVAVDAGDDGLSGFCNDGGWKALREEITRFSQILFSGRPGEREFWTGRRKPEDIKTILNLGGPKPCVHGSDAHSIDKLFKPADNRYCWIKADPSFEGLRQILYEPEERVYIGPTPPIYHDKARIIQSVSLASNNGWVNNIEIPLNAGLVSIIGQKGSGKSALAELVAYTTGSHDADEPGSFLQRAGNHLDNTRVVVKWADGVEDSIIFPNKQTGKQKVRYLSQRFVEQLCAEDKLGTSLVKEIESVIFSYLDPPDTMGASNFGELRTIETRGIEEEGQRLRNEIDHLIREKFALHNNELKLEEKEKRISVLTTERVGLEKQIPDTVLPEDTEIVKELQEKHKSLNKRQQESAQDRQTLQKIGDIKRRIKAFKAQVTRFYNELAIQLDEVGVPNKDISNFKIRFTGDIEDSLASREATLVKQISDRLGDNENPSEGTIRCFQKEIKNLETRQTADKARQKKIRNIHARVATINSETERITAEIFQIKGPEKKRAYKVQEELRVAYVSYFSNLKQEQKTLEKLYAPVTAELQSGNASKHEQKLEFSIRWVANIDIWIKRGARLFDQRRKIPYDNIEGMTEAARRILAPAWMSGNSMEVGQALELFLEKFKEFPPSEYLRSSATYMDVLRWIYEVEHISLNYGLKYNGTALEKLSPGTKGIVLLILYLGINTNDTRPLIVDQPDENLDNETIFHLLSDYFRIAKKRRQIVLITHNPNLVVNTDSEQVIVAHADPSDYGLPHIQYVSGSLENTDSDGTGIRQRVCNILEGGTDAFLKRERRYALETS